MYKLVLLVCFLSTVEGGGHPLKHYSYSYLTPDGQTRYETNAAGKLKGGYQYRTPEGAVVAVRYSSDEHAYRATGDDYKLHYNLPGAYRRLYSYSSGGVPIAYRYTLPKRSHAFSYATPDGQSRYETNSNGLVKGGYQYRTPEGAVVSMRYTADEHGFRTKSGNYIYHNGPEASRRAYSYSYSGFPLSRPVIRVQPEEVVIPNVEYVRPVSYYYGTPGTYYGSKGEVFTGFPYSSRFQQKYTLPVNLKQQYNTAKIEYEPVESHGYVISF